MVRGAAAVAALAWTLAACGSTASPTPVASTATVTTAAPQPSTTRAAAPKPRPKPPPRRKPSPSPGRLPQTHQLPSVSTRAFGEQMAVLWRGVQTGSVHAAMAAFFPEAAYAQVKAYADPGVDWTGRLVRDYGLDLAAAHALLGAHPAGARLVHVMVPAGYVHWVDPGACHNRIGYYEVAHSRVVYRQGSQTRSFGIASMISWRGVWYVIHLGSIEGPSGVVDDPSAGPGSSAASLTC
jgi:hypothetical protein